MTGFVALEMRRSLRDARYLIISVAMPIGFYLLFTGLFGAHGQRAQGLPRPVELMIAMIAYGAMWAVFSTTGPRIAHERAIGWDRQLRITPLSAASASQLSRTGPGTRKLRSGSDLGARQAQLRPIPGRPEANRLPHRRWQRHNRRQHL